MKQENNKLIPEKGKFLATKDLTQVFESVIYLGIYDSIENYVEIDKETRDKIIEKQNNEKLQIMG